MEIISRPTFIDRILGCSSSVHSSYCCSHVHGHRHLKVHNSPLPSHSYSILDVNLGLIIRYKGQGSCLKKNEERALNLNRATHTLKSIPRQQKQEKKSHFDPRLPRIKWNILPLVLHHTFQVVIPS